MPETEPAPMPMPMAPGGAFEPGQTHVVAGALAAFSVGLTFNGMMLMLNRGFFSLQQPWVPTAIAMVNLALNVALYAVFYRVGTWGIPFAISLANIAGVGMLLFALRRRLYNVKERRVLRPSAGRASRAAGARVARGEKG